VECGGIKYSVNGIIRKTNDGTLQKIIDFFVKPNPEENFPATASITKKKCSGIRADTEVAHLSQTRPSAEVIAR
jgi:hypothetical protein